MKSRRNFVAPADFVPATWGPPTRAVGKATHDGLEALARPLQPVRGAGALLRLGLAGNRPRLRLGRLCRRQARWRRGLRRDGTAVLHDLVEALRGGSLQVLGALAQRVGGLGTVGRLQLHERKGGAGG